MPTILAIYFIIIAVIVTGFQIALAFGAPLGAYTLGGRYPGALPKRMRWAAAVQILILWVFVYIVAVKVDMLPNHPDIIGSVGIWVVVAFFIFGSITNLSSPSKPERRLWGPINVLTFIATLAIAIL